MHKLDVQQIVRGPLVPGRIGEVDQDILLDLLRFYNAEGVNQVCLALERHPPVGSVTLSERARFYQYVTLNGRRITPLSRSLRSSAGSSIIRALFNGAKFAGELLSVFDHLQPGFAAPSLFGHVRWMRKIEDCPLEENVWVNLQV